LSEILKAGARPAQGSPAARQRPLRRRSGGIVPDWL